ncbi:MAG: hypothetical protein QOF33_4897, partial [Thermomicrobiales bacterium]|nr:hypothetical protein [Thermomicrobiales bacterium]
MSQARLSILRALQSYGVISLGRQKPPEGIESHGVDDGLGRFGGHQ